MTETYGNSEHQPNSPLLFATLFTNIDTLCRHYGKPFYLTFVHEFHPFSQDSEYFLNTYPILPTQLHGVPGVLNLEEKTNYEGDEEGLTITEAGVATTASSLGADDRERECRLWLFNDDFCLEYERIGELAISNVVAGQEFPNPTIYWIEFDGSVWHRPPHVMERVQLSDAQLDQLIRIVQWIIPW